MTATPPNPLIHRLEHCVGLDSDSRAALLAAMQGRVRQIAARRDIIAEGDRTDSVTILLSGWACRTKQLEDGRRQIAGFLLPGDFCDLQMYMLNEMDHSVSSLSPAAVCEIGRDSFERLLAAAPRLVRAFVRDLLVEASIQREWVLSLGQRSALERIGHLLCEIYVRLKAIGQIKAGSCAFPLTQTELADATGLSTVHVNRTLQELRAASLIVLDGHTLTIPDFDELAAAALFSPAYLHLDRPLPRPGGR